jgi:hypothetical protein
MTLLDFEIHFRADKIVKARDKYLKGHVGELKKESEEKWLAKIKIGWYNVHVSLSDIDINSSWCNCDDRPFSGYCNHSVAVLFAIRKELNLFPALTTSLPKLPRTDVSLNEMLEVVFDPDFNVTSRYTRLFTNAAEKMLQDMQQAIVRQEYAVAAGIGFSVISGMQVMKNYLENDYKDGDAVISKIFALLKKWWQCPVTEVVKDAFAHDARIEAVRNFNSDNAIFKKWMDILVLSANADNRKQKLLSTIDTLCHIEETYFPNRVNLLQYKNKIK